MRISLTKSGLSEFLSNVASYFSLVEEDDVSIQGPGLMEAIEEAKSEWLKARSYFEAVTEPELIDYAIYTIEAAERKYIYLLKQAKQMGHATAAAAIDSYDVESIPEIATELRH